MPLLPQIVLQKRKNSRLRWRLWVSFAEAMRLSDAKTQPKPRKLPSTNSSDWLVWGGMPRHGRPRIAAVCDACRRRKRSAAFERKGRLAAAAADAADGIGHAARSTRRRGAPCAHGAAPGQQQPANNPVLLPLSAALGGLSVPSGVARAPRSAVHPPSAAAAGLSGSRLFSSQAGSGTCPAGAAASSGAAPQGRHEAEIGAGAACERRKQAGKDVRKGRSLAEVGAAFFELRRAWGCRQRVCSSRCMPAGAAASSGAAPQGRPEAEIGAGAACE